MASQGAAAGGRAVARLTPSTKAHRRPSGNYYKGDLKNSKMHGVGTFQWAGGTKYVGQFENSDFNGTGTKTHANGKVEKGRWKDDKFLG